MSIGYSYIAGYVSAMMLLLSASALAQTRHHLDHLNYQNWINKRSQGCCNNNDCGQIADVDERTTASGALEVRIEGTWCPVQSYHYLMKGNAPDWSTSHVCVQKNIIPNGVPICARLLCYQPKPLF